MATENSNHVVILDDDASIRDSLAVLLKFMNLPTKFFASATDFLGVAQSPDVGCLLLDLRLPGGGFSVLEHFHRNQIPVPVIVMTGHGDEESRSRAMQLGAFAFFEKPFDSAELCQAIEKAMARSQQLFREESIA